MSDIEWTPEAEAFVRKRKFVKACKVLRQRNMCGLKLAWEAVQAHPDYRSSLELEADYWREADYWGPTASSVEPEAQAALRLEGRREERREIVALLQASIEEMEAEGALIADPVDRKICALVAEAYRGAMHLIEARGETKAAP